METNESQDSTQLTDREIAKAIRLLALQHDMPVRVFVERLKLLYPPPKSNGELRLDEQPMESALETMQRLGLVGAMDSGHADYASNPKHLEGMGR